MAKKKEKKVVDIASKKPDTIVVTNRYLEMALNSPVFSGLRQKKFSPKTGYWIARSFDKMIQLAKTYQEEKKKLFDKYAEEKDEQGNPKVEDNGSIKLTDPEAFAKAIVEEYNCIVPKERELLEKLPGVGKKTSADVLFYGLDPLADLWADEIQGQGLKGIRFRMQCGRTRITDTSWFVWQVRRPSLWKWPLWTLSQQRRD